VEELLAYLDDNFAIPDDRVNSDIKGLDDEDFNEGNNWLPEVALSEYEVVQEETNIPSFSQPVGTAKVIPRESLAVEFFQLFVDNRMLGSVIRETNRHAC